MKLVILFLILTVFVLVVVKWQGRQYQAFLEKADKITGEIVRKESRNFRPNQYTGQENWVTYQYNIGGKEYSGEEKVEFADLWHSLKEGDAAAIYYNRENPGDSHLAAALDKRM